MPRRPERGELVPQQQRPGVGRGGGDGCYAALFTETLILVCLACGRRNEYVGSLRAQRGVREEVLVCVCVLRGRVGGVGAWCDVAEEAVCECPWRGAGECGKEGLEGG